MFYVKFTKIFEIFLYFIPITIIKYKKNKNKKELL